MENNSWVYELGLISRRKLYLQNYPHAPNFHTDQENINLTTVKYGENFYGRRMALKSAVARILTFYQKYPWE